MKTLRDHPTGDKEFKDTYLRELDMAICIMHPAERPAYLEAAYIRAKDGAFASDFLLELAELLEKYSNEKRNFRPHAEKLREIAQSPDRDFVPETAERRVDSGIRDLRGNRHSLVEKVLSSPPGPMRD